MMQLQQEVKITNIGSEKLKQIKTVCKVINFNWFNAA
jgi:hypothetical protein